MAKDGTARGGQRTGSGRKSKALADKILEGQRARIFTPTDLDTGDLEGEKMPDVRAYLKEKQHNGIELEAEQIYSATWKFLVRMGVEKKINLQILELYAMNTARWIQCERAISQYGLLAKHPTTGGATVSPYVHMSHEYSKQSNAAWYQIAQVVKENSEVSFNSNQAQNDLMEQLLTHRK